MGSAAAAATNNKENVELLGEWSRLGTLDESRPAVSTGRMFGTYCFEQITTLLIIALFQGGKTTLEDQNTHEREDSVKKLEHLANIIIPAAWQESV